MKPIPKPIGVFTPLLVVAVLLLHLNGHRCDVRLHLRNQCPFSVWPTSRTWSGPYVLSTGGNATCVLHPAGVGDGIYDQQSQLTLSLPNGWSGQFWARTGCESDWCQTGHCGPPSLECLNNAPLGPVTIASIVTAGIGGRTYYEVSLEDGYNVPIQIRPRPGSSRQYFSRHYESEAFECGAAGCHAGVDLNLSCPPEPQAVVVHKGEKDGSNNGRVVVACRSACQARASQATCCTGPVYSTQNSCRPLEAFGSPAFSAALRRACPDARVHTLDRSGPQTFWCQPGWDELELELTFCPQ